jgi:hypothetical protein
MQLVQFIQTKDAMMFLNVLLGIIIVFDILSIPPPLQIDVNHIAFGTMAS